MTRSTQGGAAPGGSGPADGNGRRRRIRAVPDHDRERTDPTPDAAPADGGPTAGRPRIVVADADPQVARTIAAVLGPTGAAVIGTVGRVTDAPELADRLHPDLVILDAGPLRGSASAGLRVAAELHRRRLAGRPAPAGRLRTRCRPHRRLRRDRLPGQTAAARCPAAGRRAGPGPGGGSGLAARAGRRHHRPAAGP